MYGELQEIDITEELVRKIAEEHFRSFDDFGELGDQKDYVQRDWEIGTAKDLDIFNDIVKCLKNTKHTCEVVARGFHDVNEFYPEDE